MLGLGNTLSGGIVPAAAATGFNTYSIDFDGVDGTMTNMTSGDIQTDVPS